MCDVKVLFGKRIKELRRQKGLTQEALAEKVGIEANNISRIEVGKSFPSPENLPKLAHALDTDIKDLFSFNHLRPYSEIASVLQNVISDDEYKGRMIYRFLEAIR